ncbi:SusC/RagA family TonB-linked outer membrane protein [Lewinella sp. IMCC34191]|uniref:SusC/RagA family TonB-linked outer membrane protein n=1 Tax=Lewinella sp. IMCC34191 TaxID=2259172 RepID=UPI000E220E38|nr:TonB-dependent receptor [Lewinella sp. IMCC34191]
MKLKIDGRNAGGRAILLCLLFLSTTAAWAQRTVTGSVTDAETKEPLIGASVTVAGESGMGTVTDLDGTFSLEVPEGAESLDISYTGYTTETVSIAGVSNVEVSMANGALLNEVVVIGYGTQKKADVTGAIASFDAENLDERPIARVDQALVGQMAGVRVQQTSGLPGAGFSIQIRGTGSIGANNEPLYVVDGFPLETAGQSSGGGFGQGNPLDNISPNDIASIEVLKDAAAAAIYGSRASNGVVLITTKKGGQGKAQISLNTSYGWNKTAKKLDVLSAEEWIDRASEVIDHNWVNSGEGRTADQTAAEREAIIGGFNNNLIKDPRWDQPGYPGLQFVDWQDELFRTGVVQNHTLSARGGNDIVRYYVSGDYLDSEGIAIGVGYKQYSARANLEVSASDRLTLGLNVSPSYSIANDPGVEGKDQQMHIAAGMAPVVDDSVGLNYNTGDFGLYNWGTSRSSPVRVVENSIGESKIFRTISTLFAEYRLLDGVRLRSSFNLDNADQTQKRYTPAFVTRNRTAGGDFSGYRRQTFVNENTVSLDRTFGSIHNISAVLGTSYNATKFDNFAIRTAGGFNSEVITTLNAANINPNSTFTAETENTLISFFGRVQYNLSDRYLITGSLRRDGSSRFGPETKWGTFPSVSLGWRVSEESFMQNVSTINTLKLRGSWGISGNNGIGNYSHVSILGFDNYSFGGSLAAGQVPTNFANSSLSWETSETVNVGVDLGFFENRIYTSFDVYTKRNSDLLLSIPIPTAVGFGSALTNIGEVLNRGWEFELQTQNLTGEFRWTTNLNFSHNNNEVVQLGPENAPILGGAFDINHNILMVGQPMYSLYVVQQDGILSRSDIESGVALYGNQEEGDPRYVDADGDGVITPDDRVLSGHPNPDYVWGVTNTFRWKGFDLSVLVQGQWGGKIYSTFGRGLDRTGMGFVENTLGLHRDRWRSAEDPGAGERGKAYSSFGRIKNTDWLYPSDYWRVRNITLGYDLGSLINVRGISNARLYTNIENYFGGDKYDGGYNPEAVNSDGDDYGAFPLSKSIVFGLNLSF